MTRCAPAAGGINSSARRTATAATSSRRRTLTFAGTGRVGAVKRAPVSGEGAVTISADFSPLDTTQRQKVLSIIDQLSNAGLSEGDIQRYFQQASTLGQQNLQQGFNAAALSLGQQFTPQFQAAQ